MARRAVEVERCDDELSDPPHDKITSAKPSARAIPQARVPPRSSRTGSTSRRRPGSDRERRQRRAPTRP